MAGDQSDSNNNINHNNVEPSKRLRHMGWYWGSISPDYAAKLLEFEEEGTFLIRDSSSTCYIYSMTFKLENAIHHARIEYCKGQFSFGRSFSKFVHTTIIEFIEHAIEYSHNGNLLFFLHRDPSTEGPVRLRMIPLSRFKCHSSLKHMCRAAILPHIKRDLIEELPVPECLKDYIHEPFMTVVA